LSASPQSAITVSVTCRHASCRTGRHCRAVPESAPTIPERLSRLDGVPFALGNHADEVALSHNPRAGNVLDRAFIDARRLGTGTKGALTTRQHDAAMQHSWHADVLHVHLPARHLVDDVDARYPRADELIAARRLLRCGAGELDTKRLVAEQVAVFDRAAAALATIDTMPSDTVRLPICTPAGPPRS
jgi:hypothetical protein